MASSAGVDGLVKAGYWFCGSIAVEAIPSTLFNYLYACFAEVHHDDGGVTFPNRYKVQFQNFTGTVRKRSLNVKTLLSIGGEGSAAKISLVVKDKNKRAKFIKDSIDLARKHDFQGLDLCWLYPSNDDDDADLDSFLNEWRAAVDEDHGHTKKDRLLLTAAVFHHPVIPVCNFNYPCSALSKNLDWINVLAIDFYTVSNSSGLTGPVHAWLTRPADLPGRCGYTAVIQNWIEGKSVPTKKLVLCLPFHGYEWNLKNASESGFFAPATPANDSAEAYKSIKAKINNYFEIIHSTDYVATYAHNNVNGIWIGYDDVSCISTKVTEVIGKANLGGYLAWHVGEDDDEWTLSTAAFRA